MLQQSHKTGVWSFHHVLLWQMYAADAGAAVATSSVCRSAVARQAAHMYEVLAAALGFRFESYAVACMSALFKAMVITVQVRVGDRLQ
jgi:hypothetical protein